MPLPGEPGYAELEAERAARARRITRWRRAMRERAREQFHARFDENTLEYIRVIYLIFSQLETLRRMPVTTFGRVILPVFAHPIPVPAIVVAGERFWQDLQWQTEQQRSPMERWTIGANLMQAAEHGYYEIRGAAAPTRQQRQALAEIMFEALTAMRSVIEDCNQAVHEYYLALADTMQPPPDL